MAGGLSSSRMQRLKCVVLAALCFMCVPNAWAQTPGASGTPDASQEINASVDSLVTRVSRSVVQVLVTTYGPVTDRRRTDFVIGRQRTPTIPIRDRHYLRLRLIAAYGGFEISRRRGYSGPVARPRRILGGMWRSAPRYS